MQPVGVLAFDACRYSFWYIRNVTDLPGFRPLLGFPDLATTYESDELFPIFAQRVMDPRRPDYSRYLERLALEEDATPWEQIARSTGRRQGDTLQVFPEPVNAGGTLTCSFLVHGIRYMPGNRVDLGNGAIETTAEEVEAALSQLRAGTPLRLLAEPGNVYNRLAIVVAGPDGPPLGYVPDLLAADLHRLRAVAEVRAEVQQVNGPDAPSHLRLLARLEAREVGDFQFFDGPSWAPFRMDD